MSEAKICLPSEVMFSVNNVLEDRNVRTLSDEEKETYPNFRVATAKTRDGKDKVTAMTAWVSFEINVISSGKSGYQSSWHPVFVHGKGLSISGSIKQLDESGKKENTRKHKNQVALQCDPENARFYQKEGVSDENYGEAKIACHKAYWYHFRNGVANGNIKPFVDKESNEDYQTERRKNPNDKRDKEMVPLDKAIIRVGLRQQYKDGKETGYMRCPFYDANKRLPNAPRGKTPFEFYKVNGKMVDYYNIHEVIRYPCRVIFVDNMSQGQMTENGGNKLYSSAEFVIVKQLPRAKGITADSVLSNEDYSMFDDMDDDNEHNEEGETVDVPAAGNQENVDDDFTGALGDDE